MERRDVVLAALAAGKGAPHQPVQVQKMLFLLDKEIGPALGGPHFDFTPYAYGPFDASVYDELDGLAAAGLVEIDSRGGTKRRTYMLTPSGQAEGDRLLNGLHASVSEYIRALSEWLRSLTFDQLVSTIYKLYPDMQARSVFRGKV